VMDSVYPVIAHRFLRHFKAILQRLQSNCKATAQWLRGTIETIAQ
jgi:hypothetical protein